MMEKVREEKALMKEIYDKDIIANKKIASEKDYKPKLNIDLSLYGQDIIEKDLKHLQSKLDNFELDLKSIQDNKYNYQITSIVLFIVISSIGISGYWIRREYIPLVSSILLLLFAAPMLAISGIETTYTFLSIDFCSTIGNSIISGITPSEDTGLGSYISCPSKETMRTLSTAIYQYIVNFDTLYEEIKYNVSINPYFNMYSLGDDKRNNSYLRELRTNISQLNVTSDVSPKETTENEEFKDNIIHAINIFININYILAGLLSMTSCFTAKNIINYVEEFYCYENHGYMFRNIIFSIFAALGFVITAAGINKLIIVMRNRYSKALRGKKEFNTDIITEDDDD